MKEYNKGLTDSECCEHSYCDRPDMITKIRALESRIAGLEMEKAANEEKARHPTPHTTP